MTVPDDPAAMAAAQRLAEVSAILAQAILRLHSRAALDARDSHDSPGNRLDPGVETSPHVSAVNVRHHRRASSALLTASSMAMGLLAEHIASMCPNCTDKAGSADRFALAQALSPFRALRTCSRGPAA